MKRVIDPTAAEGDTNLEPLAFDPHRFPTPARQFDEAIMTADTARSMAVMVWSNDEARSSKLQELAQERNGVYVACDQYRSSKQFIMALAKALGVSSEGTAAEIEEGIEGRLRTSRAPLIIDYADRLTARQLRDLREYYDELGILIVMAAPSAKVAELADDRNYGGHFFSRCIFPRIEVPHEDQNTQNPEAGDTSILGRIGL